MQPIRVSITETEQTIRSQEILPAINEKTLVGRNPARISRRED